MLCQLWAERKRQLLVVCPSSLRKQWQEELREKFALPSYIAERRPSEDLSDGVWIVSYQFAAKFADTLQLKGWDCVVLDEAHKLHNAHKENNKTGRALLRAFAGCKKLLLTADGAVWLVAVSRPISVRQPKAVSARFFAPKQYRRFAGAAGGLCLPHFAPRCGRIRFLHAPPCHYPKV